MCVYAMQSLSFFIFFLVKIEKKFFAARSKYTKYTIKFNDDIANRSQI